MTKKSMAPGMLLAPVPAALISCAGKDGRQNVITLAWTGVVNSDPPLVSVAIRPSRFSYDLIVDTREFVINIPTSAMEEVVDGCGMTSGKNIDKFQNFLLTPLRGTLDYAPYIGECPICLECRVRQVLSLGSHDLFLGKITNVMVDQELLDAAGRYDPRALDFLGFTGGHYLSARVTGNKAGFTRKKRA